MALALYLLGHPYAELDGARVELPTTKPTCLLLYLACRGDWVSRDELAELFRPEVDEATARHGLRLLLSRAKRFAWVQGLDIEPQRLRWTPPSDLGRFREALGRGDWGVTERCYGGPLLEGFRVRDTPGFEDFVDLERAALESAWRGAALRRARDLGAEPQAAALLARVLAQDLLAEDVVQSYMRLSYLAGGREEALRVYAAFRERLDDELGLTPLDETEALAALIRRADKVDVRPVKTAEKRAPLAVRHPPQLVGRDAVRAALVQSRLPVTLLAGEPGVGKTRLLQEVAPEAMWLRCREGLSDVPYFPLVSWLRDELGSWPALAPVYLDELARLVPDLAPGRLPPPFDPLLGRSRLLEAFAQLFASLRAGGVTLVFDDLQWADAATVELLLYLAERGGVRSLGTYRSTETGAALQGALDSLRSNGRLRVLGVEPLTPEAVTDLVASLSGQSEGPPLFSRWLHARTGGNPFFILETLKALFENGVMREQDAHWHTDLDDLTRDYGELEVPMRVADTVRRRVSALSEPTKRVLGVAAVLREGFTPELLGALTGLSTWAVLDVLEEAGRVGLLREASFTHDLVRQSVYNNLSEPRRAFLHAHAAEALSERAAPLVVAEHFFRAGRLENAAAHWYEAALELEARGLFEDAARLLEDVRKRLPTGVWHARLGGLLGTELQVLGQTEAAARLAAELADTPDPWVQTCALLIQANQTFNRGNSADAQVLTDRAQALLPEDAKLKSELLKTQINLLQTQGKYLGALELLEPALARLKGGALHTEYLALLADQAAIYDNLGRFQEATPLHREALRLARHLGSAFYEVQAVSNFLANLIDLNRPEEGLAEAQATLERQYPNTDFLRTNLAAAYRQLGRLEDAALLFEELSRESENAALRANAFGSLAKIYHVLGNARLGAALDGAIATLQVTDHPVSHARVCAVVLAYGDAVRRERVRSYLNALDLTALPPDVREELSTLKSF